MHLQSKQRRAFRYLCLPSVLRPYLPQWCIVSANDWIPALPSPYRCRGDKVQQGYSAVTVGWECDGKGGRDTECTGRLAGQNAAAGSTAAQGSGQAREYFVHRLVRTILQCWKAGALASSSAQKCALCCSFQHKIEQRWAESTSK